MLKRLFITGLTALACAAGLSAQEPVTLASWTFETGYDVSRIDDKNSLYTPNGEAASGTSAIWYKDNTINILPETSEGTASSYVLSSYSENRYHQICTGYQTQVYRIENNVENPSTDYTNPTNHKAYYQVTFPTKGYNNITITYAIAPGNNTETPVELVVSTDGGNTWFDAGAKNTSGAWFQYADQTVGISANNKDEVTVRLLPTAGTTNWNLRNLSISGTVMASQPSASNETVTFAWPMGSTTIESAATASNGPLFSVYELAAGPGLTLSKTATPAGGSTQTLFKAETSNGSVLNPREAISMTIVPKKGITFRPTGFSFQASRHGTGGGNLALEVKQGDNEPVMVREKYDPERSGTGANFSTFTETLSGFQASSDPVTVTIYYYKLGANKELGLADLTLTGIADGEVEAVPVYSFALKSAIEGAGALSCTPAGAEFDEGTPLTVSASENFGYHFINWTDADGKVVSEQNPYTFSISGNTSLTANYEKNNVYALNLAIEGGANVNQVLYQPQGNVVNGVHYYEEGTEVMLTTVDNRILSFTNWEDNSTSPVRTVRMDGDKDLTATFSAVDYIVGWDFYFDQPNSERAADYRDESDNSGLLSLRNPEGKTTTWLTRGVSNGAENGRWGARIWKEQADNYYYEVSLKSTGYSNLRLAVSLGCSYNTYNKFNAEYSIDGVNYSKFADYTVVKGWSDFETPLPAEAANQGILKIRFMPDKESGLNDGSESSLDGLCISDLYILADKDSSSDETAPVLVSTIPADKSGDASATGSIILTFDEKVKIGTSTATLNGEPIAAKESGKSIIYNYAGLDYNTDYTFIVPAGAITDRNGNAFEGTRLTFTTMERVQPEARLYDLIVAADGTGDHTTLQAAIDAAPAGAIKPYLIFVKNGRYKEHIDIPKTKPYIHIIGQDRDKTVIHDDKLCGGDNALHVSVGAPVVVNSNDCLFENITLENSYGHEKQEGPQALALNTTGDRTVFNNVAMLSYQDTWITPSTSSYRAYVRNSFIEGAVDFIYNSGDIFIDNTILYINRKSGGYIVAPSHGADVKWGYVFNNCTITAPGVPSETSVWLGRPWHNAPKTVFLNTRAEVTIPATGWYETMGGLPAIWADWNTVDGNGNPVDLSQRRDTYYKTVDGEKVYGKAKNHLTDEEAAEYTVRNVLSGSDNWQPVIKTESCDAPSVTISGNRLSWAAVPYAICYVITRGDELIDIVKENSYTLPATTARDAAPYTVQAVNEFGGLSAKGEASDIPTGIDNITGDEAGIVATEIYDVRGLRHESLTRGVNIVKYIYSDGSVKVEKKVI